jgi:hypothetical protein
MLPSALFSFGLLKEATGWKQFGLAASNIQ